jgi:hypothetical protein
MMLKSLLIPLAVAAATSSLGGAQASVRVEPARLDGPRHLEEQTATAAIRDYLHSWQSLGAVLEQNRADLLDADFVGAARDKLADTVQQQAALGIRTLYRDRSHDLQIVFYSPDGLSIELTDKVDYDMQILDHDKIQTSQRIQARYVVVLTPAEVRWRVRVFQAAAE